METEFEPARSALQTSTMECVYKIIGTVWIGGNAIIIISHRLDDHEVGPCTQTKVRDSLSIHYMALSTSEMQKNNKY